MTDANVTVCVITYNYGHYLAGSIESALAQEVPAKVMVVDDGSTDDSRAVAASFGDRVRYLWKPNGGLPDARNFGLERCDTPFLLFLDADDRLAPDFLKTTMQALEQAPEAAFAYVQLAYFTGEDDLWTLNPDRTHFPEYSAERLKRGNYINAAALLRMSALRDIRFDTRLRYGLEDWEFFINLATKGAYGVLVGGTALRYRTHSSSMGHSLQRRRLARRATYVYVIAKHWRFFGMRGALGFAERSVASRASALSRRWRDG